MPVEGFGTNSIRMERVFAIRVLAPEEDVDRIMGHVCRIVPLEQGAMTAMPGNRRRASSAIVRVRGPPLAPRTRCASDPESSK